MKYRRRRRIVRLFLMVVMAGCLILLSQSYLGSRRHRAQQNELRKMVDVSEETAESEIENGDFAEAASAANTEDEGGWQKSDGQTIDGGSDGQQPDPGTQDAFGGNEPQTQDVFEGDEMQEQDAFEGDEPQTDSEPQEAKERAILRKYAALYRRNEDLAGWLFIDGTGIDYPVLQCEDDEYYLHHDFYGEESQYGCLYVRERADLDEGTNFIIYGHNMRDGAMFGDLDLYLKESFFLEHPTISFDTLYEERVYEIVAVFRSQVYHAEDEVFKYYQFYEADTREEFEDFYTNIKALSIYDTGVEAEFGDTFLTCSTCAYHVEDGRFVVVAKRRTE